MGFEKHMIQVREENWKIKAESEGWRCAICGSVPPFEERDVFFKTGKCGWCAHMDAKKD